MDDPRRLREILDWALGLAKRHSLTSVLVGLAGNEGDTVFPEIEYVKSGLRVDDSLFRMTHDARGALLADVSAAGGDRDAPRRGVRPSTIRRCRISLSKSTASR